MLKNATEITLKTNTKKAKKKFFNNIDLWLFLLPALVYVILFKYWPMFGIQIAFRDYSPVRGFLGSPWVGFEHFQRFFNSYQFVTVIKNTIFLSFYVLLATFPIPIVFALLLNQLVNMRFKKLVQTATYIPHFISVVTMVGIVLIFLSPQAGFIPKFLTFLGKDDIPLFMAKPEYFRHIYVISGVWQSTGWSSIIYIAALSGVDPAHHEAAIIDGANKLQRIWHVDIPSIIPTSVILLILNFGRLMSVGFQKAYLMQNNVNLETSEIIATYVYKVGLEGGQYSYSTAISLFNSLINLILIITVNSIAKKLSETSLW